MADARSQDSRKLTNENEDKFIILGTEGNVDEMNASYQSETKVKVSVQSPKFCKANNWLNKTLDS